MADISKIKTLDGTTYDIKDSTARSSMPTAATATPLVAGTGAVGTATKYAREDHVHPAQTTVNGHTVNSDVPANAVFTDTNYVPSGGSTGQVLTKTSSTDYAVGWSNPSGLPSGGSKNQFLVKNNSVDGNASWKTLETIEQKTVVISFVITNNTYTYNANTRNWHTLGDSFDGESGTYDKDGDVLRVFTYDEGATGIFEEYQLIKKNRTASGGDYTYTWLFGRTAIESGSPVFRTIEISGGTNTTFQNATITVTERDLGLAPSATGVSF